MKPKKLSLNKKTISNLNFDQLGRIVGGIDDTRICPFTETCGPTCETCVTCNSCVSCATCGPLVTCYPGGGCTIKGTCPPECHYDNTV